MDLSQRRALAMTGLAQCLSKTKSNNKEIEDIEMLGIEIALCTQRARLKPLCSSVSS